MDFTIADVIAALGTISVSGEQNLDTLLGCIRVLRDIDRKMKEPKEEPENGR